MLTSSTILTINAGSSSIKFAVFEVGEFLHPIYRGSIERIGSGNTTFQVKGLPSGRDFLRKVEASTHLIAGEILLDWIKEYDQESSLVAIGHRIVHGGNKYSAPEKITEDVMRHLRDFSRFAPEHLPNEILLIEAFGTKFSSIPQFACFDTSFHHDLPRVAQLLPIPLHYEREGIRRYGFHGISYQFLMEELTLLTGNENSQGKVVLVHLGSGASLCAVYKGKSMDTSMSFTPAGGIPMGTRSGDLDPGLFTYFTELEGFDAKRFDEMVNFKSGLFGLSETSSDMEDLLHLELDDIRAREAVALFCYQVKKWIGAFSAALGGLDTLVFSGGIGENAPTIRERICEGLEFLGVSLEEKQNRENSAVISKLNHPVTVRVIKTDEERMIAKMVFRMMQSKQGK